MFLFSANVFTLERFSMARTVLNIYSIAQYLGVPFPLSPFMAPIHDVIENMKLMHRTYAHFKLAGDRRIISRYEAVLFNLQTIESQN